MYKTLDKNLKFKFKGYWFRVESETFDSLVRPGSVIYFNMHLNDIVLTATTGRVFLKVTNRRACHVRGVINETLKVIEELTK